MSASAGWVSCVSFASQAYYKLGVTSEHCLISYYQITAKVKRQDRKDKGHH